MNHKFRIVVKEDEIASLDDIDFTEINIKSFDPNVFYIEESENETQWVKVTDKNPKLFVSYSHGILVAETNETSNPTACLYIPNTSPLFNCEEWAKQEFLETKMEEINLYLTNNVYTVALQKANTYVNEENINNTFTKWNNLDSISGCLLTRKWDNTFINVELDYFVKDLLTNASVESDKVTLFVIGDTEYTSWEDFYSNF